MIDFQSRKRAVCSGSTLDTEHITDIEEEENIVKKAHEKGISVVPHAHPAWWPSSRISLNYPAGSSLVEGCSVLFMHLRLCVACYPLRQQTRALIRLVRGIPCWGLVLLVGMVSEQGNEATLPTQILSVPTRLNTDVSMRCPKEVSGHKDRRVSTPRRTSSVRYVIDARLTQL